VSRSGGLDVQAALQPDDIEEIVQKINGRNNYRLKEIKSAVFQAFSN
jgi:hypothetical protein